MAGYRGHLTTSTALGVAYGAGAFYYSGVDPVTAGIATGLTAVSGMLPDLDSDSGVPVRLLFGVTAIAVPLLMLQRLIDMDLPLEKLLLVLVASHFFIRFGAAAFFKQVTVHRGMFHSLPGMLIAGLAVLLLYHDPVQFNRFFLAGGVMLGFLSHLVLDELCSVDLAGAGIKLNKYAGSALKLTSPSWLATLAAYVVLLALAYGAAMEFQGPREKIQRWQQQALTRIKAI